MKEKPKHIWDDYDDWMDIDDSRQIYLLPEEYYQEFAEALKDAEDKEDEEQYWALENRDKYLDLSFSKMEIPISQMIDPLIKNKTFEEYDVVWNDGRSPSPDVFLFKENRWLEELVFRKCENNQDMLWTIECRLGVHIKGHGPSEILCNTLVKIFNGFNELHPMFLLDERRRFAVKLSDENAFRDYYLVTEEKWQELRNQLQSS